MLNNVILEDDHESKEAPLLDKNDKEKCGTNCCVYICECLCGFLCIFAK
jgi:hypothetical protein